MFLQHQDFIINSGKFFKNCLVYNPDILYESSQLSILYVYIYFILVLVLVAYVLGSVFVHAHLSKIDLKHSLPHDFVHMGGVFSGESGESMQMHRISGVH